MAYSSPVPITLPGIVREPSLYVSARRWASVDKKSKRMRRNSAVADLICLESPHPTMSSANRL